MNPVSFGRAGTGGIQPGWSLLYGIRSCRSETKFRVKFFVPLSCRKAIDVLSDDLADVESVVFDEDEDDGDYFEVECPNCEEPILIDDEALAAGEVQCPNCETRFALDLSDDTVDADEDAE